MPGNPADIGGAEVDVVVVKVEDQLAGVGCVGQIAAGGVHHALGLARGAAGIEEQQRVLGVHVFANFRKVFFEISLPRDDLPQEGIPTNTIFLISCVSHFKIR